MYSYELDPILNKQLKCSVRQMQTADLQNHHTGLCQFILKIILCIPSAISTLHEPSHAVHLVRFKHTVKPLYYGDQGDRNKCLYYRGACFREIGFIIIMNFGLSGTK